MDPDTLAEREALLEEIRRLQLQREETEKRLARAIRLVDLLRGASRELGRRAAAMPDADEQSLDFQRGYAACAGEVLAVLQDFLRAVEEAG